MAKVDLEHWLSPGLKQELHSLVSGSAIYSPIREDKGANVVRFAAAGKVGCKRFLWDQNRQQLAFKPYVVAEPNGEGMVIGFTQDQIFAPNSTHLICCL